MLASWPQHDPAGDDRDAREQMETLIALITKVRNIRSEWNVPPQSWLKMCLTSDDVALLDLVKQCEDQIKRLARVKEIEFLDTLTGLKRAARDIVGGIEIAVPFEGLIDLEKERERIGKEVTRKENEARSLAARLDNVSFMERAPREVVQETRGRHEELIAEIKKLRGSLGSLGEG
jgi:valyl-tRNA synthetase